MVDFYGQMRDSAYTYGGLAVAGSEANGLAVTDGGFTVKNSSPVFLNYRSDSTTYTYHYLAVK